MQRVKCHRQLRRLAKSTSKIESKPMNIPCMSDIKHYLSNILKGSGLKLVIALLENSGVSKHRRRWTDEVRRLMLYVHYCLIGRMFWTILVWNSSWSSVIRDPGISRCIKNLTSGSKNLILNKMGINIAPCLT
jgi:hypothetical protein